MGDHAPCAGLVLRGHIHGKFNLRFLRHSSGGPSQYRGCSINLLLGGAQVIAELGRKPDELTEEKLSGFET